MNSELWHACAGPLVSLPALGSRVVYFPQGHSEQVSTTRWLSRLINSFFPSEGYLGIIFGWACICRIGTLDL